jgi:uncharacterized protein YxeA
MLVDSFKNVTAGIIYLIGVIITAAIFIKATYETATEAKARVIRIEGQMSEVADKVADRMIIINNQNMYNFEAKLEKIHLKLDRIERKVGE